MLLISVTLTVARVKNLQVQSLSCYLSVRLQGQHALWVKSGTRRHSSYKEKVEWFCSLMMAATLGMPFYARQLQFQSYRGHVDIPMPHK